MKRTLQIMIFLLPVLVIGSFVKTGINGYSRARFEDLVEGRAFRPYVERPLIPFLVRNLSAAVPSALARDIDNWAGPRIPELSVDRPEICFTHLLISAALWYASIVGFAFCLMKLTRAFYDSADSAFLGIAVAAVAGLPTFFLYNSYIYDFSQLFLFTVCLLSLAKREWIRFILLFALASWNKETAILLTVIFAIQYRRLLPRASFLGLLGIQLATYSAIRIIIFRATAGNPGLPVELHISHNLLLAPYSMGQFAAFTAIVILTIYDWGNKPLFFRNGLAIAIPMIILAFLFGYIDEYRDFYELYPVIVLLTAHTVVKHILKLPFEVRAVCATQQG